MTDTILERSAHFSTTYSDSVNHSQNEYGGLDAPPDSGVGFEGNFDPIKTGVESKSGVVTKGPLPGASIGYELLHISRTFCPDIYRFSGRSCKNKGKRCMFHLVSDSAEMRERTKRGVPTGKHQWGGAVCCGSIHQCAICSGMVRRQKSAVIQELINRHLRAGGSVSLLTLTVPHYSSDSLKSTIDGLSASVESFWKSRQRRDCFDNAGFVGSVRNLEITYGFENGWHPHSHILMFFDYDVQPGQLERSLFPLWRDHVFKRMGRKPNREHGLNVIRGESAAEYVAKAGISASKDLAKEITHSHTKLAKGQRMTPFGILARVGKDDSENFLRLWTEFCVAVSGRHAIGRFDQLKAHFGLSVADEERIVTGEAGSILKTLVSKPVYHQLLKRGLLYDAIRVFDRGGSLADLFKLIERT